MSIVDTFAEAFDMRAARVAIRARSPHWARTAAQSMRGFATSVIGRKVEAGIEADLRPEETLDGRPDERGPTGLHEAFEDEFSPLSSRGTECADPGIPVCGICEDLIDGHLRKQPSK